MNKIPAGRLMPHDVILVQVLPYYLTMEVHIDAIKVEDNRIIFDGTSRTNGERTKGCYPMNEPVDVISFSDLNMHTITLVKV